MINGLRTCCFAQWGLLGALLLALTACGGGGGGGGGFIPGDPSQDLTSYVLTTSLLDAQGNPVSAISPTRAATLRVQVRENNPVGAAVAGAIVNATVEFAVLSPENGSSLTDDEGVATFSLTGGVIRGADTATITVESPAGVITGFVNFEVVDIELEFDLQLLDADGLPTTFIAPDQSGTLRVAVTEVDGGVSALPSEPVVVTASTGFATIVPANGSALTDPDGVAVFELRAGTTSGADTVTVSASNASNEVFQGTLSYQIFTDSDVFALSLALLDSNGAITSQIDAGSPASLQVLLTRTNSLLGIDAEVVSGQVVSVQSSDAGAVTPANGSAITDENGIATFGIAAGTQFGAQTISASIDSPAGLLVAQLPYEVVADVSGGGLDNLFLSLVLRDSSGRPVSSIESGEPAFLEATVEGSRVGSATRERVPGIQVSLTAESSIIEPTSGNTLTDGNGVARFRVAAGNVAGTDVLTASVLGPLGRVAESLSVDINTELVNIDLQIVDDSGQPARIIRDGQPLTLQVTLTDAAGAALPNRIVQTTSDVALLSPSSGRALTDASGVALLTLSAGDVSGAGTATVTVENGGQITAQSITYAVLQALFDLELSLVDPDGNPTTRVTSSQPATLRVQVVSLNRPPQPVAGLIASAQSNFVTISPQGGTALTNDAGLALFTLSAGATAGADQVTVTIDTGTGLVTETIGVEANAAGATLGAFIEGVFTAGAIDFIVDELPFGGNTRFNLAVIDDLGDLVSEANQIRLTSDCAIRGDAGIREIGDEGIGGSVLVVETVEGLASAEYNAINCVGTDEVRATLVGGAETAAGTITVAPANANYIGFFGATPSEGPESGDRTVIAIAGTGVEPIRPETARITFEVLAARPSDDPELPGIGESGYLERADRNPIANARVDFELVNDLAGILLCNPSGGCTGGTSISLDSDQDGLVVVGVQSGSVPTQTFVRASYTNPDSGATVVTASNQVVVSTGVPDQNSFSVGVEGGFYVGGARTTNGLERRVQARLADRFNNPVPDGTPVLFRTEYGAIDASCETGRVNGARLVEQGDAVPTRGTCSVLWTSQAPRFPSFLPSTGEEIVLVNGSRINGSPYSCPDHDGIAGPCPNDLGAVRGLRSSILAYALGDEDFSDLDGDGLYSAGEPFNNCLEAFIDFNETSVYDDNFFEEFIDLDNNNSYGDSGSVSGQEVYNGTLCTRALEAAGICSRSLVNVSQVCAAQTAQTVITLSSVPQDLLALFVRVVGDGRNEALRLNNDAVFDRSSVIESGEQYELYIADIYNNRPGSGSELSFELNDTDACEVRIRGEFIGGDNPGSVLFTLADPGGAAGASSFGPIVLTNPNPATEEATAGEIIVRVDGVGITSIGCPLNEPLP